MSYFATITRSVSVTCAAALGTDVVDPDFYALEITSVTGEDGTVFTKYDPTSGTGRWQQVSKSNTVKTELAWKSSGSGDYPATNSKYTVVYTVTPILNIRGTDFIKAAFTAALRTAYSVQEFYPLYTYDPDDTKTKISIVEALAHRVFKNPAIVVQVGDGKVGMSTIGDREELGTISDSSQAFVAYTTWGKLGYTAKIDIYATEDLDCRKLTDLTTLFCRDLFRFKLAQFGIAYTQIDVGGVDYVPWQGAILCRRTISIPCYTEFKVIYPEELLNYIDRIKLTLTDSDSGTVVCDCVTPPES